MLREAGLKQLILGAYALGLFSVQFSNEQSHAHAIVSEAPIQIIKSRYDTAPGQSDWPTGRCTAFFAVYAAG